MKTKSITLVAAVLCIAANSQAAVLVTPTGITSNVASSLYPVGNLIDNSGFGSAPTVSNYATATHANVTQTNSWATASVGGDYFPSGGGGGTVPVLTIDLGATYELTDFIFWGYQFTANEAKTFNLTFSTTGTGGTFSGNQTFSTTSAIGQGGSTVPTTFGLTTVSANAVRISITDNYDGDRVAFGELKFLAVPEPSTALLGAIGFLALLRRRR